MSSREERERLATVVGFLLGENALQGYPFGEGPVGGGRYWWRTELRAAFRERVPGDAGEGAAEIPVLHMNGEKHHIRRSAGR